MTPSAPLKILAPVDRVEEVALLARAGAHELYGGVAPRDWPAGQVSSNQRTFASAQFPSESAFAEAAQEARRLGLSLHLALNAPVYGPSRYGSLLGLARRAAGWGVAGAIVGDPGLLVRLCRERLPLEVTLSTLAGARNASAVGVFRRLGVRRVVLPRHLTLDEVARVVGAHPDLSFEAFVLMGRCPNEEALCTFQHVSPSRRWPCEIPYDLRDPSGAPLDPRHPLARWHARWAGADRRLACGVCALARLRKAGVRYVKLVGRGGPTEAKVAHVGLVAGLLAEPAPERLGPAAYRACFGRPCHPLTCYFPELRAADREEPPGRGSQAEGGH
ncbi:MAG: hypothetical protein Kow0092_30070 [Deferrisomatales bacterium]